MTLSIIGAMVLTARLLPEGVLSSAIVELAESSFEVSFEGSFDAGGNGSAAMSKISSSGGA